MRQVVYVILDGWGIAPPSDGNAIWLAKTPTFDYLWQHYPHTEIGAAGEAVGLWKGHQGSSEIGHFIIGAGRNVLLPQGIVAKALHNGEFDKNKAYLDAINYAKKNNSTLHLIGLMSDKGVHNYDEAVHELVRMAAKNELNNVVVHFITDGRDTEPYEAEKYLNRLKKVFEETGTGKIGTVMGRYWIMDRDHRWERVEKGYKAMVYGEAEYKSKNALEAIKNAYKRGEEAKSKGKEFIESDEFIKPTVIVDENDEAIGKIEDKDAVIWVNFRTDRAIEATQAFVEKDFKEFDRGKKLDIDFVCTFEYYEGVPAQHAFEREIPKNTLGEIISKAGLKQFRVTETEKWIYVTTIFSGMREEPFPGEDRLLIPSDKIPTYDLKPKMHTLDIAKAAADAIRSEKYNLVMMNFNNPDIIGHTGNIKAVIEGVEECDNGLKIVTDAAKEKNALVVISADHGNAEVMITKDGEPNTHHTTNNVPFIIVDDEADYTLRNGGALKDVTPTILDILNLEKPKEMTGKSLITKK